MGSLPGGGEHPPSTGKPEAAQPGTHLVNARFNSNGDTAFAGALLLGGPGRKSPVCIDQGGNNRCCGDVLIAVRCGGNFLSE